MVSGATWKAKSPEEKLALLLGCNPGQSLSSQELGSLLGVDSTSEAQTKGAVASSGGMKRSEMKKKRGSFQIFGAREKNQPNEEEDKKTNDDLKAAKTKKGRKAKQNK